MLCPSRLMIIWYITALNTLWPDLYCVYVCMCLFYIMECILRAKFFFFQKIEKHVVLLSPYFARCLETVCPPTFHSRNSCGFCRYQNRAASSMWKRILLWSLTFPPCFSRAYKRSNCPWHNSRLVVPVSLICNHEAEATELCRTFHALVLFFLLKLGSLIVSSLFRHRFDTEERVSLMLGDAIKIILLSLSFFFSLILPPFPRAILLFPVRTKLRRE